MVTGVETAGLVLASFPLIISVLEHYRKGLIPLQLWWNFQTEYTEFSRTIDIESVMYKMNLKKLLLRLVPEDDMKSLLADPGGDAWRDPELEGTLRDRLPHSYGQYFRIISDFNNVTSKLLRRLGIRMEESSRPSRECSQAPEPRSEREMKRFRFAFSKGRWDKLAKKLHDHNLDLERLLGLEIELAPPRRHRIARLSYAFYRKQAYSLHTVLTQCWTCSCQSHQVNLLLDARARAEGGSHFEVLLASTSLPVEWHEAAVKVLKEGEYKCSDARLPPADEPQEPVTRRTYFTPSPRSISLDASLMEIQDLCLAIRTPRHQSPLHGFLQGCEGRRLEFLQSSSEQARSASSRRFVTLETLLTATTLTRRERYKIAATLASAFLQLHATPWLRKDWSKKDILFLEAEENGARRPVIVERAYVARDYKSRHELGDETVEDGAPLERSSETAGESLFRLGVILLELCFGQALEDHRLRQQYVGPDGQVNDYTDRITAFEWQKDVLGESGFEFANAIRRCLNYSFSPRNAAFARDEFEETIYVDVIQPLENVSRRGWEDLDI